MPKYTYAFTGPYPGTLHVGEIDVLKETPAFVFSRKREAFTDYGCRIPKERVYDSIEDMTHALRPEILERIDKAEAQVKRLRDVWTFLLDGTVKEIRKKEGINTPEGG